MNNILQNQEVLPEKRHSVKEIFYAFTVILPPAFLFSLKQDLPHVFLITFLLSASLRRTWNGIAYDQQHPGYQVYRE